MFHCRNQLIVSVISTICLLVLVLAGKISDREYLLFNSVIVAYWLPSPQQEGK